MFRPILVKSKTSGVDSLVLPPFFNAFSGLRQDFSQISSFCTDAGQAVWWADNPSGSTIALSCITEDYRQSVIDSLTAKCPPDETVYRGTTVYQLDCPGAAVSFAYYRNLLLIGRLPLQVEAQITQLAEKEAVGFPASFPPGSYWVRGGNLAPLLSGMLSGPALSNVRSWEAGLTDARLSWRFDSSAWRAEGQARFTDAYPQADDLPALDVLPYLPANLSWCTWSTLAPLQGTPVFEKYMAPWLGADAAQFALPFPGPAEARQVMLLRTTDGQKADQMLNELGARTGQASSYTFQVFQIRQLFTNEALQPFGWQLSAPYAVVLGDYVAFGATRQAVEQVANNYLLNQSIALDPAFQELWKQAGQEHCRSWFYFDGPSAGRMLQDWVTDGPVEQWSALRVAGSLQQDGTLSLALSETGKPEAAATPELFWAFPLPAPVASGLYAAPQGGVIFQDTEHRVQHLGADGALSWSYPAGAPMIGTPAAADYYGEEPYCLAFATESLLHMVSPDGSPAGAYPLELPSPATSSLLIAPLEGTRFFASFVGTQAGVYGFNREGQPLPHWLPNARFDSTIRQPMRHFQFGGRDYLLALTEKGTLYAKGREGEARFDSVALGGVFASPPFVQADQAQQRIALGDQSGFAHAVNLQGTHFRLQLIPGASGARFLFAPILGDARHDYLCWTSDRMVLHYYEGNNFKEAWAYTFPEPPAGVCRISLSGKNHIAWWSSTSERLYLLSPDGVLMPGFPVAGGSKPVVLSLSAEEQLLLSAARGQLYAYKVP